jgi:hypothetical protein
MAEADFEFPPPTDETSNVDARLAAIQHDMADRGTEDSIWRGTDAELREVVLAYAASPEVENMPPGEALKLGIKIYELYEKSKATEALFSEPTAAVAEPETPTAEINKPKKWRVGGFLGTRAALYTFFALKTREPSDDGGV